MSRTIAVGAFGYMPADCVAASPIEAAARALDRTLAQLTIDRQRIQMLVFASSCFWGDGDPEAEGRNVLLDNYSNFKAVRTLLNERGLMHAQPFGSFLGDGGSLVKALQLSRSFVLAEGFTDILVVSADCAPIPSSGWGLSGSTSAVQACLMSTNERLPLQLERCVERTQGSTSSEQTDHPHLARTAAAWNQLAFNQPTVALVDALRPDARSDTARKLRELTHGQLLDLSSGNREGSGAALQALDIWLKQEHREPSGQHCALLNIGAHSSSIALLRRVEHE